MTTSSQQSTHSASSGNAIKSGIYSDRILAGEDPQKLLEITEALIADHGVQSFTGKRLCSDLALVMFKQDRLERHLQQLCQSQHQNQCHCANQQNLFDCIFNAFSHFTRHL